MTGRIFRIGAARTWIIAILAVSFAVRAIIPAGYMPDFSALSRGVYKTVICHGVEIAVADKQDPTKPHKRTPHAHQPCAFSGLAAVTLATLWIAPVKPSFVQVPKLDIPIKNPLPPARVGPVLGSRGPPHVS
jgi:hypothetical protein